MSSSFLSPQSSLISHGLLATRSPQCAELHSQFLSLQNSNDLLPVESSYCVVLMDTQNSAKLVSVWHGLSCLPSHGFARGAEYFTLELVLKAHDSDKAREPLRNGDVVVIKQTYTKHKSYVRFSSLNGASALEFKISEKGHLKICAVDNSVTFITNRTPFYLQSVRWPGKVLSRATAEINHKFIHSITEMDGSPKPRMYNLARMRKAEDRAIFTAGPIADPKKLYNVGMALYEELNQREAQILPEGTVIGNEAGWGTLPTAEAFIIEDNISGNTIESPSDPFPRPPPTAPALASDLQPCPHCGRSFDDELALIEHVISNHETFGGGSNSNNHMFNCPECSMQFRTEHEWEYHMVNDHRVVTEEEARTTAVQGNRVGAHAIRQTPSAPRSGKQKKQQNESHRQGLAA